jgi:hypothetical protein
MMYGIALTCFALSYLVLTGSVYAFVYACWCEREYFAAAFWGIVALLLTGFGCLAIS